MTSARQNRCLRQPNRPDSPTPSGIPGAGQPTAPAMTQPPRIDPAPGHPALRPRTVVCPRVPLDKRDPPFGASVTVHLVTVVVTPNWDFCAACNWQGVVTVQATADEAI